jgi:hypothetical protein
MEGSTKSVNQPAQLANAHEVIAVASLLGRDGRVIESTIVGQSMGRALAAGTRVRIRCGTQPGPLGAVVVIAGDGALFAHRIVGRGRGRRAHGYLLTRGDRTVLCDGPVEASRVIGTVTECREGDGWRPVPGAAGRSPLRAWLAAAHRGAMLAALEAHVALARGLARISFGLARALAPLTLFRRGDISVPDRDGTPPDPL